MPLALLLPLVVFGIAGIAVLLHLMGNSTRLRFDSEAAVLSHWARQFPHSPVLDTLISDDAHQALVDTADGPGLLWSMGADAVCRLLADGCAVHKIGDVLVISVGDYTAPTVKVTLANIADRQRWLTLITGDQI